MECSAIPAKVIATCFSLVGFVAAVVVGWAVDNPTFTILYRALVSMFACWLVGYGIGAVGQRVVERHIEEYKRQHPIVSEETPTDNQESTQQSAEAQPDDRPSPAGVAG